MTTSVQDVLVRVRHILQDQEGVRWVDDELVRWVNDGQREVVLLKPDAYSTRTTFACATGTLQTLPSGAIQLLDVTRNLGGTKRAIRQVSRYVLDAENPTWHNDTTSSSIRVFAWDDRDPSSFYVYPPAIAATPVEVVYSVAPAAVTANDDIVLNDIYVGALVDYICYRAFSKDADYAQNAPRAQAHYQQFAATLGVKNVAEQVEGPREALEARYVPRANG